MSVLALIRRAIRTALAAAVLCQPISALAQAEPALDITLADGRLTMNVQDASLSLVLRDIAAQGGFVLDITGEFDPKVSASFENVPIDRALRRIVGRSSYIIELAPPAAAGAPRRIAKLSVFARSAPARVETSSKPRSKRRKQNATKTRPGTKAHAAPPAALAEQLNQQFARYSPFGTEQTVTADHLAIGREGLAEARERDVHIARQPVGRGLDAVGEPLASPHLDQ